MEITCRPIQDAIIITTTTVVATKLINTSRRFKNRIAFIFRDKQGDFQTKRLLKGKEFREEQVELSWSV